MNKIFLFFFLSFGLYAQDCTDKNTYETAYEAEITKISTSIKLLTGLLEGQPIEGATPLENTKKLLLTPENKVKDEKEKLLNDPFYFIYESCFEKDKQKLDELKRLSNLRIQLLAKLLELPFEKRSSLVALYQVSSTQEAVTDQIKIERDEAIKAKEESDRQIEIARNDAQKASDLFQKSLAASRAELETYRSDLAAKEIKWTTELEQKSTWYLDRSKELASVNTMLLRGGTNDELVGSYEGVTDLWRSMISSTFELLDRHKEFLQLPGPKSPTKPEGLPQELGPSWNDLSKSFEEVKAYWQGLRVKTQQRLERELSLHYGLLLEASKLRSRLFDEGKRRGLLKIDLLSGETWTDFRREFEIIPYRFIATFSVKWIGTKESFKQGAKGIASVLKDFFILLIVIFIPFFMWKSVRKASEGFEILQYKLMRDQRGSSYSMAYYLQKLVPYVPWLLGIVFLGIAQYLIGHTAFPELATAIDYAHYLIFYNLFKMLLSNLLAAISLSTNYRSNLELKEKVNRVSGIIGIVLFSSLATLELFEGVIGRGLIYNSIYSLLVYGGMLMLFYLSAEWKEEIVAFFKRFSEEKTTGAIQKVMEMRAGQLIASLPLLLWIVLMHLLRQVLQWSSRFDFSKKISARLFKRRLESSDVEEEGEALPQDYRKLFTIDPLEEETFKISTTQSPVSILIEQIKNWHEFEYGEDLNEDETEVEEHSVAIYGAKGIGKSTVALDLANSLKDVEVLHLRLNRRITTREKFFRYISHNLKIEIESGGMDLRKLDSKLKKTVVILDDAHNLFLSHVNGFEAYKAFLELVNAQTRNIFWVALFNDYAWNFLNNVFGRNQFFSSVISLKPWKESDIQKMIMSRHSQSQFKLSFDDIIHAAKGQLEANPYEYVETKFFRLLWEQSKGNPRVAIYLWLSSLSRRDEKTLKVGIPDDPDTSYLTSLSEVSYFIYAEVAKHENMNSRELIHTSGLEEGIVRNALKLGLEGNFLYRSSTGRYRMTTRYQNDLLSILKTKNMIYAIE